MLTLLVCAIACSGGDDRDDTDTAVDAGKIEVTDSGTGPLDAGTADAATADAATVDTVPPTITAISPADNAVGVVPGTTLGYTFSEKVLPGAVTVLSVPQLEFGAVIGDSSGFLVSVPITTPLAFATKYTVTVNAVDAAENMMVPVTHAFTTVADTSGPTVTATTPANGALNVVASAPISVEFSRTMNESLTASSLQIVPARVGTTSWNANTLVFTPAAPFPAGTTVSVKVLGANAKDAAGRRMDSDHNFSFKIAGVADTTRPMVVSSNPPNTAASVAPDTSISWNFSEPMDQASTEAAASVKVGNVAVPGMKIWASDGKALSFSPTAPFANGAVVTYAMASTAKDLAGNTLMAPLSFSFTIVREATVELVAISTLDGMVTSTGTIDKANNTMLVGDTASGQSARGFIGFDLTPIDNAANQIVSAELSVYQLGSYSVSIPGSPYGPAKLGDVHALSVDFGPALEAADYNGAKLSHTENDVVLATADENGVTKTINVLEKVRADWAARSARGKRCQFRLQFDIAIIPNSKTDGTYFGTAESNGSAGKPRLKITYRMP